MSEERIKSPIARRISDTPEMFDSSESIQMKFEDETMYVTLARKIYSSDEAGIREPLQNSITAIINAVDEGYISDEEALIEIELHDNEEQSVLIIKDNGVGISEYELENDVSQIGRSSNKYKSDRPGSFGMGLLACYRLVGVESGGFIMVTRSRRTDENISGIWKPGEFEWEKGKQIESFENEYGTKMKFYLKEELKTEDIREWVEKHAFFSPHSVIYNEYNKNGNITSSEEYGNKNTFTRFYDGEQLTYEIENDYFRIVAGEEADGRTLLFNSPIERNRTSSNSTTLTYDIQLKNENGVIISGPNEGLEPVYESEYNEISDENKDSYIKRSDVIEPTSEPDIERDDVDIKIPEPTGTRQKLQKDELFWKYMDNFVENEIISEFKKYISSVQTPEEFFNLPIQKQSLILTVIDESFYSSVLDSRNRIQKNILNDFGVQITDEMASFYHLCFYDVIDVNKGTNHRNTNKNRSTQTSESAAGKVYLEKYNECPTYMGVKIGEKKLKAIWEKDHDLVRVSSSDVYNKFQEYFGWKLAKKITEHIDIGTLSDDLEKSFRKNSKNSGSTKKPILEREITVHKKNTRDKLDVESIKDEYSSGDEKLIVFPSNSDKNLTDHKHAVCSDIHIANCLVKAYEELQKVSNIHHIEEWENKVNNYELTTNKGSKPIREVHTDIKNGSSIFIHPIKNEYAMDVFKQSTMNKKMGTYLQSEIGEEELYYVPVSVNELNKYVRFKFTNKTSVYNLWVKDEFENIESITRSENTKNIQNNVFLYANMRLHPDNDEDFVDGLKSSDYKFNKQWHNYIDEVVRSGSISVEGDEKSSLIFKTDKGIMSIEEIESEFEIAFIHYVSANSLSYFTDMNVNTKIKREIYNNIISNNSKINYEPSQDEIIKSVKSLTQDDIVYIPVIKKDMKTLKYKSDIDKVKIMGDKSRYRTIYDLTVEFKSDTYLYAQSVLNDEKSSMIAEKPDDLVKLQNGGIDLIESIREIGK